LTISLEAALHDSWLHSVLPNIIEIVVKPHSHETSIRLTADTQSWFNGLKACDRRADRVTRFFQQLVLAKVPNVLMVFSLVSAVKEREIERRSNREAAAWNCTFTRVELQNHFDFRRDRPLSMGRRDSLPVVPGYYSDLSFGFCGLPRGS
jgi:hypothetical protein